MVREQDQRPPDRLGAFCFAAPSPGQPGMDRPFARPTGDRVDQRVEHGGGFEIERLLGAPDHWPVGRGPRCDRREDARQWFARRHLRHQRREALRAAIPEQAGNVLKLGSLG